MSKFNERFRKLKDESELSSKEWIVNEQKE